MRQFFESCGRTSATQRGCCDAALALRRQRLPRWPGYRRKHRNLFGGEYGVAAALSYPEPDRIVQLELSSPQGNGNITSIPKFNAWREQTQVFQISRIRPSGGHQPDRQRST
jgi:hypothetical protein